MSKITPEIDLWPPQGYICTQSTYTNIQAHTHTHQKTFQFNFKNTTH